MAHACSNVRSIFIFYVCNVREKPKGLLQSLQQRKEKKGSVEGEIRSSLLMLDLKEDRLYDPGKEDEGKSRMLQNEIEEFRMHHNGSCSRFIIAYGFTNVNKSIHFNERIAIW